MRGRFEVVSVGVDGMSSEYDQKLIFLLLNTKISPYFCNVNKMSDIFRLYFDTFRSIKAKKCFCSLFKRQIEEK